MGHLRRFKRPPGMSALPPIASEGDGSYDDEPRCSRERFGLSSSLSGIDETDSFFCILRGGPKQEEAREPPQQLNQAGDRIPGVITF
jgi:hypothetical protein